MQQCTNCRKARKLKKSLCKLCRPQNHDNKNKEIGEIKNGYIGEFAGHHTYITRGN